MLDDSLYTDTGLPEPPKESLLLARRLPSYMPCRQVIAQLVLALPVRTEALITDLCARLRDMENAVPWLPAELGLQPGSFERARDYLHFVAGNPQNVRAWSGMSAQIPILVAVMDGGGGARHIEVLRAFLVIALLRGLGKDAGLPISHFRMLASSIRGLASDPAHRYHPAVSESVLGTETAADAAERLGIAFGGLDGDLATKWKARWGPYLRSLPPPPRARSPHRTPRDRIKRDLPPRIPGPRAPPEPGEAPEEIESPIESSVTDPPDDSESPRDKRADELQRLRSANHAFLASHIDTLDAGDCRTLIDALLSARSTSPALAYRVGATLILLALATGREIEDLADAELIRAHEDHTDPQLAICLATGNLVAPMIVLPNQFRPGEDNEHLYAARDTSTLRLQLPPSLHNALLDIDSAAPRSAALSQLTPAGFEIRAWAEEILKALPIRHDLKSFARIRTAMVCQLMHQTRDLPRAMAIVGNTFSRSEAHLYYVSFAAESLRQNYVDAVWPLFRQHPRSAADSSHESQRSACGPAYPVRPQVAKEGARHITQRLNRKPSQQQPEYRRIATWHNRFSGYLAQYLAVITGHRPEDKLYALTTWQIDWDHHYLVAKDKRVDVAHMTRPVAMTPQLSAQVLRYIEHLDALRELPWLDQGTRDYLDRAIAGDKPVGVYLTDDYRPRLGTLQDWDEHRPPQWSALPRNWYRAHLATSLRNIGADPVLIQAHMGHLDSAGHPYSADSPISPRDVSDGIRPSLQKIERSLGLQLRCGWSKRSNWVPPLPRRTKWADKEAEHVRYARETHVIEGRLHSEHLRSAKADATNLLGEVAKWCCPALKEALSTLAEESNMSKRLRHQRITEEELGQVMDAIADRTRDDGLRRLAALTALSRTLRHAAKRLEMKVPPIGLIVRVGNTDPAPLLTENPVATRIMGRLRTHVKASVREFRHMPPAVRRAYALVVYGGYNEPGIVTDLACMPAHVVRHKPDGSRQMLVLELGDRVHVVSGAAALAFLVDADISATPDELNRCLAADLPPEVAPTAGQSSVEALCAVARVAGRYEQSGLQRHSRDPVHGAYPASRKSLLSLAAERCP